MPSRCPSCLGVACPGGSPYATTRRVGFWMFLARSADLRTGLLQDAVEQRPESGGSLFCAGGDYHRFLGGAFRCVSNSRYIDPTELAQLDGLLSPSTGNRSLCSPKV